MYADLSLKLPRRIEGLNTLAYNLWGSWNPGARDMFKVLDRALWKNTQHNPVRLLHLLPANLLETASRDREFLAIYDTVMADFELEMSVSDNWCRNSCSELSSSGVAYFSMEFAIHHSLPIYAGGLGVLAGDYCKEASDLGLPVVGVGFMYPQGYFQQRLTDDGCQVEVYSPLDFDQAPLTRVVDISQRPMRVDVLLDSRSVRIGVCQVNVGRVKLYLLDSDLEENTPDDRKLTARLYNGGVETRLQQEILLGMGGVRVLRALGVHPAVWHANEGHTSFMMVERCRELVQQGMKFAEAAEKVRAATVFTTHTPVPAGNDLFPHDLVESYFHRYWDTLGLGREEFLALGTLGSESHDFNMTVLGLRMADRRNGVSLLHARVCRRMWHAVWPHLKKEDVPICAVTNGVHVPTWVAPEMARLFEKYVATNWLSRQDEPEMWDRVESIPDREFIDTRRLLKNKLVTMLVDKAREHWSQGGGSATSALGMGALLDNDSLTIGFSRRFTDYKRAALILHDVTRLKRILLNESRPVQVVFAGKAHPDDQRGKVIIQEILRVALDRGVGGRVGFVEDYDMHSAHYLVQGVDVWLNTPRMMQEASGTSGMKAGMNGVPHLSVLDGWWHEAYDGTNGWVIVGDSAAASDADQDANVANALYRLLEEKVIPLYYGRDMDGVPRGWARMAKQAIRSTGRRFCARRMAKEYAGLYLAAAKGHMETSCPTPDQPGDLLAPVG